MLQYSPKSHNNNVVLARPLMFSQSAHLDFPQGLSLGEFLGGIAHTVVDSLCYSILNNTNLQMPFFHSASPMLS